jgi:phosphoglycolate phosphatase-like HAD superfamily hydrolase
MIRGIVFDFDGTLVDSYHIKRQSFFDVVKDIDGGAELIGNVLSENPGDRYAVFERFVQRADGANSKWDRGTWAAELVAEYTRRCEEKIVVCAETPGIAEVIQGLREQGIVTAINSATPSEALNTIIFHRGWRHWFDYVLGGPTSKCDNLRRLADMTTFSPDELIMVGDQEDDRLGAAQFSCRFVALMSPNSKFSIPPTCQIDDLRRLPEMIHHLGIL